MTKQEIEKKNKIKNRRGLRSVIGAVFFLIIMVSGASYILYSMNQLDTFSQAIIAKNQQDRNKIQESFQITSVTLASNKFNVTVQNTGMIPVNITRMWVQNMTDPTWPISKYVVNQVVTPGQTLSKIGQTLPLYAKTTQAYGLTLITDRGNSAQVLVNSASVKPLTMQLSVIPDTIPSGFDTTILFAVANNMSNNGGLANLQPNLSVSSSGATVTRISGPEPSVYPFLAQGDTAYFKWVYSISGSAGQQVNFTASLQNGYLGNSVSRNATITAIPGIPTVKTVMGGGLSSGVISSTSQYFIRLGGDSSASTNYNIKSITMPIAGTFKNLYATKGTGGSQVTFTLYKNGGPMALSCQTSTSAPSTCQDLNPTHSVTVLAYDTIAMGVQSSDTQTNRDLGFTVEFDPS
jgi:hypothetical protein